MSQQILRCPNCTKLTVNQDYGLMFFCGYCKRLVEGLQE